VSGRITKLAASGRRAEMVAVYVDGERAGVLPAERAYALGIEVGVVLDRERRGQLDVALQAARAYAAAVRMLAARPRSTHELIRRLRAKQHPPAAAAEAVGRLASSGLLDDSAFAGHFARQRMAKGYSGRRIVADLQRRGVERRVAERAVERVEQDEVGSGASRAETLARRRIGQLSGLPDQVIVRRTVGYLARRGFASGAAVQIVRRLVGRNEETDD